MQPETKICRVCGDAKPAEEFKFNGTASYVCKDGSITYHHMYDKRCTYCRRKQSREYQKTYTQDRISDTWGNDAFWFKDDIRAWSKKK